MTIAIIGTKAISIILFRKSLIKELVNKGYNVYALAIDYNDEQKKQVRNFGAEPVDYFISRSGLNPIKDILSLIRLIKILRKIDPNIVYSYFAKPVVYGTLAAKILRVPKRIAMLEGLGYAFTTQNIKSDFRTKIIKIIQLFLYRHILPLSTHLFFLNPDDQHELLIKHKIKVISSSVLGGIGLNLIEFNQSIPDKNNINFLFVGRLIREKGINEFLAAALIIKNKNNNNNISFTVLGDTEYTSPNSLHEDDLNWYIQNKIIEYHGHVSNIKDFINSSSVFVLPSYREGVPRSTQEAMAMGRAVITTDVPGCRETVVDGVNGFFIPPFNSSKLAERMQWFIDQPDEIVSMGNKSRIIAESKFDERVANKTILNVMGIV